MLMEANSLVELKKQELKQIVDEMDKKPKLVILRVGNDPASEKYVINKIKLCSDVGIHSKVIHLSESVTNDEVADNIQRLNADTTVNGILLQLPLPKHLNEKVLTEMIKPEKDVDGFTIHNLGCLTQGCTAPVACTPKGIMTLLNYYNIDVAGKDVLIINRSNIVGKPLALLMLQHNATVTIAHSKTKNLSEKVKNADIVVTAIGKANMFNAESFKEGSTIIDVSINFDENGKMCGDVCKQDYDKLINKGCNITPVPGGVGRTTVLSLIEQTIEMFKSQ